MIEIILAITFLYVSVAWLRTRWRDADGQHAVVLSDVRSASLHRTLEVVFTQYDLICRYDNHARALIVGASRG